MITTEDQLSEMDQDVTSSDTPNSNYKRECKRLRFIQGTGKTSVDDEAMVESRHSKKARYQNTFGLSELILQALPS